MGCVALPAVAESPTVKTVPEVRVQVTPAVQKAVTKPDMRTRLRCREGRCVSVSEKTALPAPAVEGTDSVRGVKIAPVSLRVEPSDKRNATKVSPD